MTAILLTHAHVGHYPLTLSPDMLWAVILQGLAQHVKNNAERLRPPSREKPLRL